MCVLYHSMHVGIYNVHCTRIVHTCIANCNRLTQVSVSNRSMMLCNVYFLRADVSCINKLRQPRTGFDVRFIAFELEPMLHLR